MIKSHREKKIETVLLGFFQKQKLNRLVKNLLVYLPNVVQLTTRAKLSFNELIHPLLHNLVGERLNIRKKVAIIDLKLLHDTLALKIVHLRRIKQQSNKIIKLGKKGKFKYDTLNMAEILKKQGELLHVLLEEQKVALKDESQKRLKHEMERIENTHNLEKRR
jgi:hypothetical protein